MPCVLHCVLHCLHSGAPHAVCCRQCVAVSTTCLVLQGVVQRVLLQCAILCVLQCVVQCLQCGVLQCVVQCLQCGVLQCLFTYFSFLKDSQTPLLNTRMSTA